MPASVTMDGLSAHRDLGATPAGRPRIGARLLARLRARHLDHELAHGVDPASDRALGIRASRLVNPATGARLAASLEQLQRDALRPARLSSRVPMRRDAVREARAELRSLAAELRADDGCRVRGVALVQIMITDGASRLYGRGPNAELIAALRDAYHALRVEDRG